MNHRVKGILCSVFAAVFCGLTPLLCLNIYKNGGDAVTVTCIRSFIATLAHFALMRRAGESMRLAKKEMTEILLISVVGIACTDLFLSGSYNYIPGGLATTIHFTYPVLSVLCEVLFFRERMSRTALAALAAVTAGIVLFSWRNASLQMTGILMALLSGICYTFYLVMAARSGLRHMNIHKLLFYVCLVEVVFSGAIAALSPHASFHMNLTGWGVTILLSLAVNVASGALLQTGIREIGLSSASMLSTLEPLTSVLAGIIFCGDAFGTAEFIGCLLVCGGIILLLAGQRTAGRPTAKRLNGQMAERPDG